MKTFALRLKQKREEAGLTQREFSDELKIYLGTYQSYEALGKNHCMPKYDMLIKISDALNTTTDYLLGRE